MISGPTDSGAGVDQPAGPGDVRRGGIGSPSARLKVLTWNAVESGNKFRQWDERQVQKVSICRGDCCDNGSTSAVVRACTLSIGEVHAQLDERWKCAKKARSISYAS